ncbi:gliding motility-associated peptidyl-prolyl isomerase GldI [Flavobacteriaceae bacterium]|nr:gliding motility-associated peptidyl-prolyl isomerase GldI [Flavobacteriaceae bacterium]
MKKIYSLLLLVFLVSCQEIEPRHPINKKEVSYITSSAKHNKNLFIEEERLLNQVAKEDSSYIYKKAPSGYLFAYINKSSDYFKSPQKGELVSFEYSIETLQKKLLYNKKELGIVNYRIDQEDLLPALREGLRIMKVNEVVVFLFPSYLCYGYQGDGHKIGINQPLRFTIERLY